MPSAQVQDELDTPVEVSDDTVGAYARDGFAKLPGLLSARVIQAYEPEITRKLFELNTMHLPLQERSTYHKAFLQVGNLWRQSELVQQFVFGKRLAAVAARLMGVDRVRLFADQALYKEEGGGITPWHADQYHWPLSSDRTITAWVPLQATPTEMGPLSFARGSQHFAFGRDLPISDESEATLQKALAEQEFDVTNEPYDLGEVSFHSGWTFHHANPNRTRNARKVMTVIYMDADIRVTEPIRQEQQEALEVLMPGAEVGAVPDTPLNPVLYES